MTSPSTDRPRRRGRRPAGEDTRTLLLDAARAVFSESGYDGATVRGIAGRAGVDAAMVNHWFGSKENLFAQAILQLPFDPEELVAALLEGPADQIGERIVRKFLTLWDATGGGVFTALIRSVTTHEQAIQILRELFLKRLFGRIQERAVDDRSDLRATLCASQIIGMGMIRYVAKFEPFASADIDSLVPAIAPTLQRYLTGDIGPSPE